MNFLIDAQLPRRLAGILAQAGHNAVHTLDLPHGNSTTDADIIALADQEHRVVVTKDDDFLNSLLVSDKPARLLLITTDNIANAELERLIRGVLDKMTEAFASHRLVELTRDTLVIHE